MQKWFEYHCWEDEESADAELWHHTHQQVQILCKAPKAEDEWAYADPTMYRVRFADGFEWDVFDDELVASQSAFERPDYIPT